MCIKSKTVQVRGARIYFPNFGRTAEMCPNLSFAQFCAGPLFVLRNSWKLHTAHYSRLHTVCTAVQYTWRQTTNYVTRHITENKTIYITAYCILYSITHYTLNTTHTCFLLDLQRPNSFNNLHSESDNWVLKKIKVSFLI